MRCGFSANLLTRPNVDVARLLDCAPIETLLIIMSCRSEANYQSGPYHSEGIELRGRQHRWISVKLPLSGKS
jgi:hypothetical protein